MVLFEYYVFLVKQWSTYEHKAYLLLMLLGGKEMLPGIEDPTADPLQRFYLYP